MSAVAGSSQVASRRASGIGNLLRFLFNWKVKRGGVSSNLPLEVSVEVTNVCNFACTFCPQSSPTHFDEVPKTFLDPERARLILQQVRDLGYDKPLIHWTLDGEPFVNKRFPEICDVARELGFTNHYFASNMALMTPTLARSLPTGVDYTLTVDYCADKAYFEEHRGTPRSWEKVRDNILGILSADDLDHVAFEIKDIATFSETDPDVLKASMDDLKGLFPESPRAQFYSKTFHNMTGYLDKDGAGERYQLCPYPWSSLTISANGDVVACCRDLEHKSVLGNLLETPLAEIWNGPAYQALRADLVAKRPDRQAACAGCDLPHDPSKFTLRNQAYALFHRIQGMR